MNSPLKKDPPKNRRWTYKPIPKETWEAIRNESPAFVVKALNRDRAQEQMIKIAVDALTELGINPNRKDIDLFASRTLDKMKAVYESRSGEAKP